jgi:hypothetical protein
MPPKSKRQKNGKLNADLGIKFIEKVMNNHIQGNYVCNKEVYGFYGIYLLYNNIYVILVCIYVGIIVIYTM